MINRPLLRNDSLALELLPNTPMVSISSSTLKITRRPVSSPLVIDAPGPASRFARFSMAGIEALGTVTLNGAAGDTGTGWEIAFIQAQWIETNWGYYRGATNGDGSVFIQRARPPARPHQACRDSAKASSVFYVDNPAQVSNPQTPIPGGGAPPPFDVQLPAAAGFPLTATVFHQDLPGDAYNLLRTNSMTGKLNFLREVQLEFHFCTVLAVKDPAGRYKFLKHFYWNMHWQYEFTATNTAAGVGADFTAKEIQAKGNVSPIYDGEATDYRFAGVLTAPAAVNCNVVAAASAKNPNVKESSVWHNFDVRV